MHIEVRFILLLLSFGYTLYLMVIIIYTLKTGVYWDLLYTRTHTEYNPKIYLRPSQKTILTTNLWVGGLGVRKKSYLNFIKKPKKKPLEDSKRLQIVVECPNPPLDL